MLKDNKLYCDICGEEVDYKIIYGTPILNESNFYFIKDKHIHKRCNNNETIIPIHYPR